MDETDYLKTRVDDQINWYDVKSRHSQLWYKALRIVEIVAAASIPFLTGYVTDATPYFRTAVGLLGVLVAIIVAVIGLFQFQESWVEYRSTCESLKHEKFLFITRTEPYNVDAPFPLLVQRVESMISKENTTWSQYTQPQGNDKS